MADMAAHALVGGDGWISDESDFYGMFKSHLARLIGPNSAK